PRAAGDGAHLVVARMVGRRGRLPRGGGGRYRERRASDRTRGVHRDGARRLVRDRPALSGDARNGDTAVVDDELGTVSTPLDRRETRHRRDRDDSAYPAYAAGCRRLFGCRRGKPVVA